MKFGYMSGFRLDLMSEIEFAKKYFDFTEITIQPDLLKNFDKIFDNIKKVVGKFEVLGHIHWEITNLNDIENNIRFLKDLGAKKITIHPFENLNIDENAKVLKKINPVLQKNGMNLLIENVSKQPYNSSETILKLLQKIPNAGFTLDVGHANRSFELDKFIQKFEGKIGHIHLHDNIGDMDHVFFENQDKFNQIFSKIRALGYDNTILLETFSIIKDGKNLSQEFPEIKKLHLKQLEIIKI